MAMALSTADYLKDVVGLRNDIVHKVFVCPECKTEVTISRYQVEGELDLICARCNAKWGIRGEEILDLNEPDKEFMGYKVFVKLDDNQRNVPAPDGRPANEQGLTPKQIEKAAASAATAAPEKAQPAADTKPASGDTPASAAD